MDERLKILRMAVDESLPKNVDERSSVPLDAFKELYDEGYIEAIEVTNLDGPAYLEPRITMKGREYLSAKQNAWLEYVMTTVKWVAGIVAAVIAAYLVKELVG